MVRGVSLLFDTTTAAAHGKATNDLFTATEAEWHLPQGENKDAGKLCVMECK